MKIDFAAPFRDVMRSLEQAQAANRCALDGKTPAAEFARLLGQLTGIGMQRLDVGGHTGQKASLGEAAEGMEETPMARPKIPMPVLEAPQPQRLAPSSSDRPAAVEPVLPSPPPQTPEIVSVRRINNSQALHVLNRAEREQEVAKLVKGAGKTMGVDPALALAVVESESSFNPRAISSDGHASKGLFQLLDSTGKELLGEHTHMVSYNPFDPELNVDLGIRYLRRLHDTFASATQLANGFTTVGAANSSELEKLAVAAFNAGEGRVASAQSRAREAGKDPSNYAAIRIYLPEITQQYVDRVMASKERFEMPYIG